MSGTTRVGARTSLFRDYNSDPSLGTDLQDAVEGAVQSIADVREELAQSAAAARGAINAKAFLAVGDGVTDDTPEVLMAYEAAVSSGAPQPVVYFPPGTYSAPTLSHVGNAIFVGEGVLSGAYRKMIFPPSTPSAPPPDQTLIARRHLPLFSAAAAPIVTIVGDSTGTNGNQISDGNYLTPLLTRAIINANPSKSITFHNRCVGGQRWHDLNGAAASNWPSWYATHSDPWLSLVQATAPDLLICNFGMNDAHLGGIGNFPIASFKSVMSKISGWVKVPDLVFVTNRVPTIMDDNYNSPLNMEGRDAIAQYQRTYAMKNGYGLVDLNRRFNLVRDGRDVCNTSFRLVASGVVGPLPYTWPSETRDVSMQMFYYSTGTNLFAAAGTLSLQIGSRPGNILTLDKDAGTGRLAITVYADVGQVSVPRFVTGTSVDVASYSALYGAGATYLSAYATGNVVGVVLNGNVVWQGAVERFGGVFTPVLYTSAANPVVHMQRVCVSDDALYMPAATDAELYGIGGATTGGNNINHGTSVCMALVERAAVDAQDWGA